MDHRRTPAGKALTLPSWVIIASALFCLAAAVFLGTLFLGDDDSPSASGKPTATVTTAPTSPAPTSPATTKPTDSPGTDTPTGVPTDGPRNIAVAVFNNTSTKGLARTVSAKVTAAGWGVRGTGNWHGLIPETTVYYPPGFETQANLLAKDLDFGRVRPAVSPMGTDRLTLILSGPQ